MVMGMVVDCGNNADVMLMVVSEGGEDADGGSDGDDGDGDNTNVVIIRM